MARYRNRKMRRYFRGDAALAKPEIYEFLEAEGYASTIHLLTNPILQESISHLLSRPVGPTTKLCATHLRQLQLSGQGMVEGDVPFSVEKGEAGIAGW